MKVLPENKARKNAGLDVLDAVVDAVDPGLSGDWFTSSDLAAGLDDMPLSLMKYLAAIDPPTVKALIAEVRELRVANSYFNEMQWCRSRIDRAMESLEPIMDGIERGVANELPTVPVDPLPILAAFNALDDFTPDPAKA
jgi:hypothetical protein